ncbi:DUF5651 domain-containing protein [Paenibacillus sp. GCM10023248]|uniref:DUF5651 domain-containing protein n=1 Tax=unclassified Paenibacillus TaxID=185978 RepID=UPI00237946A2|nr:DUF5651 domain-containing protein [Paenibacillus sp. MAHUQ-63]MDD9265992.1 DUF5651 domain-containing protein [Paenibacillus sp. MAHUQ-63]
MPDTHYRTKCPKCSYPNLIEIPVKQRRKTLDIVCSFSDPKTGKSFCGAHYTVLVEEAETFEMVQHKVKPYMNSAERDAFIILLALANELPAAMSKIPTMPQMSNYAIEQAKEWISYAAHEWVKEKDQKTTATLYRESQVYKFGLMHKREAKEIVRKNAALDAEMRNELIKEDVDVVLNLALATIQFACRECDGSPEKNGGCPVKSAMDKLSIPPYEAVEACHYAYSGLTDEEIAERKAVTAQ